MMDKLIVLVLEDADVRVEWLYQILPGDQYSIIWTKTSTDFIESLKANPDPALIILDHDLDLIGAPHDVGDGMHAARNIERARAVIVWSVNPVRAPEMVYTLKEKGIRSKWIPFYNQVELAVAITHLLRERAAQDGTK